MADMTLEQEAALMGWTPKEAFKGNPEKWVDAATFVEKGKQILPILQKNNERLLGQVNQLSGQVNALDGSLKAANAAIEALQESHSEDVKEQVEEAKARLRQELTEASRAGDHERVAEVTEKMTELRTAEAAPPTKKEVQQQPAKFVPNPEMRAWMDKNADFMLNPRKVALGNAVAAELKAKGDTRVGPAFMDAVREEVELDLAGGRQRGGDSKVESSRGGGKRNDGAKTYEDLPADAKAACDAQAGKLVGPNRAHKDNASWRASYVKQYFKGEQS